MATLIGFVFGAAIGLIAAYNRGRLDDLLMRFVDVLLAFPQLLLALVALTTVGPKSWLIIAIVGFTTIPRIARITRGAAVPVVERDFISAAEALGESRSRIITRELLPNVTGPLLVEANLRLTYSIGIIAGLGLPRLRHRTQRRRLGPDGAGEPSGAVGAAVGHGAAGDRHRAAHHRHRAHQRRARPHRGRHRSRAGPTHER